MRTVCDRTGWRKAPSRRFPERDKNWRDKNWRDEYGGHLELWDEDQQGCVAKIAPAYNTLALFNTNDLTYHGHPYPLKCPEGMSRKSLILYYYTSKRPEEGIRFGENHRALFSSREELGI